MTQPRKIRWLIAHYPVHLFQRTAEAFNQELDKLCPGQFEVEIHTNDTYVEKYNKLHDITLRVAGVPGLESSPDTLDEYNGEVISTKESNKKWDVLFQGVKDGDIEMTQTQVHIVGTFLDRTFDALDLPYLFNGHDHVSRVLDGEIGDELCDNLGKKTDIRGLAFTYSGGYRVIGSNSGITNLSELSETDLVSGSGPSTRMFEELGVKSVNYGLNISNEEGDTVNPNQAIETTYLRFTGKNVLKTNHSIFMTTILTGNKFWNSLTEEQQEAFKIAAKRVAKIERSWSIEEADQYEKDALAKGITIVDISEDDEAKLKKAAQMSYRYIKHLDVNPTLVKNIIIEGKK